MIAGLYHLVVEHDSDLYRSLALEDDAGDAINLTACTAEAYILRTPGASTPLAILSSEAPGEGEDPYLSLIHI